MAALEVFKEAGKVCDREILATEIIPILWNMSLGPLLNLEQVSVYLKIGGQLLIFLAPQFQAFMSVIKVQSQKIEHEQIQKLRELSSSSSAINADGTDFLSFGGLPGARALSPSVDVEFEKLVLGKESKTGKGGEGLGDWGWNGQQSTVAPVKSHGQAQTKEAGIPTFEWSTPSHPTSGTGTQAFTSTIRSANTSMNGNTTHSPWPTLLPIPASNSSSMKLDVMQPLQPNKPIQSTSSVGSAGFGSVTALRSTYTTPQTQSSLGIDWSSAIKKPDLQSSGTNNSTSSLWELTSQQQHSSANVRGSIFDSFHPPPANRDLSNSHPTILFGQTRMQAPPSPSSNLSAFRLAPPPAASSTSTGLGGAPGQLQQQKKTGFDPWESLL